ncbi:nose resistant to fluoxetine protein 6-like isoform X2 [Euwallacea fornicatus]|uniref:nose resistant to fluoxetine protein 6-like isoform X2 n=1 Tax=Euwallacea fornicatus TaxID=995702 RepID=UPI00338F7AEB
MMFCALNYSLLAFLLICVYSDLRAKCDNSERNAKFQTHEKTTRNNGFTEALLSKLIVKSGNSEEKPFRKDINYQDQQEISRILEDIENEKCRKDSISVMQALMNFEGWALQMFDATPKFPTGQLYSNMYQLGNFDECIRVVQPLKDNRVIKGQYCLAKISFKPNKNESLVDEAFMINESRFRGDYNSTLIRWAVCLPSTCLPEDGQQIMKKMFVLFIELNELKVDINELDCYSETYPPTISWGQIIYGVLIALVLAITILSTTLHILHIRRTKKLLSYNVCNVDHIRQRNSALKEFILSLSLIQNVSTLLQTQPNEFNLECICGIKFISMVFILAGHSLTFIFGSPLANTNFANEMIKNLENCIFLNSPLLVDSFLLVSGFLMARLFLVELDKTSGKINVAMVYLGRYIRLTPAYLVMIGLNMTWLPLLGKGPLWRRVTETERMRCSKSWWANLLYINNYVNTGNVTWYLAADFHLFVVAPIFIYLLWTCPKLGIYVLGIATFASAIVPGYITFVNSYDPTLLGFPPEIEDLTTNHYFVNAYIKTHMRATSYFIGLLSGYLVYWMYKECAKIPDWLLWLGWTLAALFGLGSMSSITWFLTPGYVQNNLQSAIYAPLHRTFWDLALGWIITVCVTENASAVNKFLSWKFFIPLSRLTYSAYLVNEVVLICYKGLTREATSWTKYNLASVLLGHFVITFSFAFVLCVCFESPILSLKRTLVRTKRTSEKPFVQPAVLRVIESRIQETK